MHHRLDRDIRSVFVGALAMALPITILLLATTVAGTASGQGPRIVRGVTRDSSTGRPLAGALIELRSGTFLATDRSDEEGNFRVRNVPAGVYRLTVLRIGFAEIRQDLDVSGRDPSLNLELRPITQQLDAYRVRGDISAIYGMVGTLPDLLPIKGARVQVLGADKTMVTDSSGGFFIPVKDPGTYIVRMSREGYVDRLFPIAVPRDRAVDASRLLDAGNSGHPGLEVVYRDFDLRLRQRSATNSALVPGAEIRRGGSNLIDGLQASPSFNARGLRIADSACVFVDGMPRPGVSLEAFRPEEIEAAEVYARVGGGDRMSVPTGDRSLSLANAWPRRASCGQVFGRSFAVSRGGPIGASATGQAFFVVVWLRK